MDLKAVIAGMIALLVIAGIAALFAAIILGRQYQAGGTKKQKYICVSCTVAAFVCIVTAVQILLMFRAVLFGA